MENAVHNLTGSETFRNQFFQSCAVAFLFSGFGQQSFQIGFLIGQNGEGIGTNLQRIVAVCLNQTEKGLDIKVTHLRVEKYVISAVLVHIAEVTVSLGIELAGSGKEIVIALRVAVLSGEKVNHLAGTVLLGENKRIAAAKEIVQITLLYVLVEERVGAVGFHIRRISGNQSHCLCFLCVQITVCGNLFGQSIDLRTGIGQTNQGVKL